MAKNGSQRGLTIQATKTTEPSYNTINNPSSKPAVSNRTRLSLAIKYITTKTPINSMYKYPNN